MKTCGSCGAKNATRALFCSSCGASFRVVDAEPNGDVAAADSGGLNVGVEKSKRERRERNRIEIDRAGSSADGGSAASSGLLKWLGGFVFGLGRLLARLFAPIGRRLLTGLRFSVARGLAPSSTWDLQRTPNFLYWGIIDCLVFHLPFSVVGIIYSVLANASRAEGEYATARRRAAAARGWLFLDLFAGIAVAVVKRLFL